MAAEGPQPGPDTSLVSLYRWLDTVPLSRPRRNIARDFSDGVLAAEVVKFFFPSMVELHSFVPTSSTAQKVANWGHLNRKVLSKLNLRVPEEMIQQLVQSRPGMAEQLLQLLRQKIQERQRQRKILQAKVGRLEQLLLLKNLRIDDLSRRLQQLQGHRR
ncbi:sperm flagellar 1 [Turdus rufiventris]|nr:sperm flagellar 1 [Turdus rufiventris]